jgi:hypothetical protein
VARLKFVLKKRVYIQIRNQAATMKANQQKIDDMYARLVAMYRDEGVVVKEIYPHKHQSANAFDNFALRQTRSVIELSPRPLPSPRSHGSSADIPRR